MATLAWVEIVGGPCDGVRIDRSKLSVVNDTFVCGGALYSLTRVSSTLYSAHVEASATTGPGPSPVPQSTDLNRAWSRLMHTLAFYVPDQLHRQRVALQRIRKAVR